MVLSLFFSPLLSLTLVTLLAPTAALAQEVAAYLQPSVEIRAVLDAKGLPQHSVAPDQRTVALVDMQRHRRITELARPVLRLAGGRIDAAASAPQLVDAIEAIRLLDLSTPGAAPRELKLPAGGGFHQLRWSPNGQRYVLYRRTPQATELWVGEVANASLRRVPGVRLNTILEADAAWLDEDELVLLTVPDKRGPAPLFDAPSGPAIQESMGRVSPERTLQDLLKNAQDTASFEHHAAATLRAVRLADGRSSEIGEPGLFSSIERIGTQGVLLTQRLAGPFSYQVGAWDFGREVELRDATGRVLRKLGAIRLKEGVPVDGVITGPRNYWGSPHADGAVYWVEALDGGNQRSKVPHRDRLLRLDPPYQGEPREVHRTAGRLVNLEFVQGSDRLIVTELDRDRQWRATDLVTPDGSSAPRRLQERSARDRYRDLGTPLTRTLANGRTVARLDDGSLWMVGNGASPEGDRPFLNRLNLSSALTTPLFQSAATHHERTLAALAEGRVLTLRESATEAPHLMLRSGPQLAQMQQLTAAVDPTPQLRQIKRELVKFKRADGVELSFWLYLPPDYKTGERRPTLVWAYPLEFTDAATAGQVSGSGSRFASFSGSSPLMLVLDGHVVLMDATMPVVGDPKTVNDSFVEQITANARALIDKAVELGVSDRQQMVVGGHSYGAFMTVNLLAHTDLFKAGIARSGAYNRTLTPFGFQSERRTYWEAQDVYLKLSPFNYADRIKEPLLLIHGENDDNPGTFPMQTQRLYQALAGTGGNVRYVSLPFESHGYSARESLGHTLREMSDWMKRQTRDPREVRVP